MPLSAKSGESGILDAIRGEEGCLGYSYYLPEEGGRHPAAHREVDRSPGQKAHLETPHMKQMAAFKPEYVADTRLIPAPFRTERTPPQADEIYVRRKFL